MTNSSALIPVQHPWLVRVLRTVQFGLARLASRDGLVEAHAAPFNLTFTGPAADVLTRHIYRLGAHEPSILRYLIDHVRLGPEDIALDVGANIGWYSVLLNRLSEPGARIFAFEPDPRSYQLLTRNLAANDATRVTAMNVALGEKPGFATLHRYRDCNNGRHTLCAGGDTRGGVARVPVDTLKEVWNREHLGSRPIRFLKVDVEGFEYFVLRGAEDLLARCACVLLEYNPQSLPHVGLKTGALLDLLKSAGLSAGTFVNGQLRPISYDELERAESQHDLLLRPSGSASART
jgi:FkbM family methyltransferase